jgi:hypothetical protein
MSQIFRSIKWDPSPAIRLQSWPILSEFRSLQTVEKWMYQRILIQVGCDQQTMSHLSLFSLFEKSLSVYQSRLMMFSKKKKEFKNTNIEKVILIELSSNFQSSCHCILLNLSLFIFHLIDLKIWDMVLSQKCNNENYLTIRNMKVVFYLIIGPEYSFDFESIIFQKVHEKN